MFGTYYDKFYYAETNDGKVHFLGKRECSQEEFVGGGFETSVETDFSGHKCSSFETEDGGIVKGAFVDYIGAGTLAHFISGGSEPEVQKILDWAGILPDQVARFFLVEGSEMDGVPEEPKCCVISHEDTNWVTTRSIWIEEESRRMWYYEISPIEDASFLDDDDDYAMYLQECYRKMKRK